MTNDSVIFCTHTFAKKSLKKFTIYINIYINIYSDIIYTFFFIHPHPQNMTLSFVIIVIFWPEDDKPAYSFVSIFHNTMINAAISHPLDNQLFTTHKIWTEETLTFLSPNSDFPLTKLPL